MLSKQEGGLYLGRTTNFRRAHYLSLSMGSRLRWNDELAISSPEVAQVKLQAYAYEATSSFGVFIPDSSAPTRE
jgi:hypothetical protein